MDVDGDDNISYKEFARVLTTDDILNMADLPVSSRTRVQGRLGGFGFGSGSGQ